MTSLAFSPKTHAKITGLVTDGKLSTPSGLGFVSEAARRLNYFLIYPGLLALTGTYTARDFS